MLKQPVKNFTEEVLRIYQGELNSSLFFRVFPDGLHLYTVCSDAFVHGMSDVEEITAENLFILLECEKFLTRLFSQDMLNYEYHLGVLFAARVRKMTPGEVDYDDMPAELVDAYKNCEPHLSGNFYEEDENIADIQRAFDQGEQSITSPGYVVFKDDSIFVAEVLKAFAFGVDGIDANDEVQWLCEDGKIKMYAETFRALDKNVSSDNEIRILHEITPATFSLLQKARAATVKRKDRRGVADRYVELLFSSSRPILSSNV